MQLITTFIKIIFGYYFFNLLAKIILKSLSTSNSRLYVKETFHLDPRRVRKVRLLSQITFGVIFFSFIAAVFLLNFAPFGAKNVYSLTAEDKMISDITPSDRVSVIKSDITMSKVTNEPVYFTTKMPFHFDTATVTITYQNNYPDQELHLGFKDQEDIWSYDTQIIDSPFLNTISWDKVGSDPTLFQREEKFVSVADFLKDPPRDGVIGTYDFDISGFSNFKTVIPDYKPQQGNTVIDTPLRGKHIMYTYLKGEPFILKVTKQDLNWYKGEDMAAVKIYKDTDLVFEQTIPDDGVIDTSKAVLPPQEVEIRNPGPEFPEAGVYKVVFEAPGDTVIKRIETNLHKIVFEGPMFPVNNREVYPSVAASTSATTLYTNALAITAQTYHDQARQTIQVNEKTLPLRTTQVQEQITTPYDFTKITIPKNDVVVQGILGYFSLENDQFFTPSPYYITPITSPDDLSLVDYVLTNYTPPSEQNGWRIATKTFDITNAVIDDDKLSWLIRAPGLKNNQRSVMIKDIQVTLTKKPMIKI